LRQYVRSLSEVIALATFPATLGMALVARDAIPWIMGQKWNGMIAPLEVLSVYAAFRSLVALLPKVLTAVGKARFVMRVELVGLFLMPLAFWIGSHWGVAGIAFGWVFAYPVVALALYWKTLQTVEMSVGEYIRALRPALDSSAAMVIAVFAFQRIVPPDHFHWVRLASEIAIGAGVYLGTLTLLHRERVQYFVDAVKRMRGAKKNQAQPAMA
jgi:teichuronic acid exporter